MIRGNAALSLGKLEEAVDHYSLILYKESTGHACALLNRSLAYVALQYPELAVMDAYRAGVAIDEIRQNGRFNNKAGQAASLYLRAEISESATDADWCSKRRRFLGTAWASSPLASIYINDLPVTDMPHEVNPQHFDPNKIKELCDALEIRACYRLFGALYMCGEGARREALGLIDDSTAKCKSMKPWERRWFDRLGNAILEEVFNESENELRFEQREGMPSLQENMRVRTTPIKSQGYRWDTWEPYLHGPDWRELLRSWVNQCSSNCTSRVYDGLSKCFIELIADRDIAPGELVLSGQTISNVTTSVPEETFLNQTMYLADAKFHCDVKYHCDTCASVLVVPGDAPIEYSSYPEKGDGSSESGWVSEGDTRASRDSDKDRIIHSSSPSPDLTNIDPALFSQSSPDQSQLPKNPKSPTSMAGNSPIPNDPYIPTPGAKELIPDFMFCCTNHKAPTCSGTCRKAREIFDKGLCNTNIEYELRTSHLRDVGLKTIEQRKRDCLRDLLMLRNFVTAFNSNTHPLHTDDITFANSGPAHNNPNADGEAAPQTWSFTDNVVRPVHYMNQFFTAIGIDPFEKLEMTEGWVINSVMSKINTAMRVTRSPRYGKLFDEGGMLDAAFSANDPRWNHLTHETGETEQEEEEKEVWVGTLTPTFDMIRIADPSRGEIPNVKVVQKEYLMVYALDGGIEKGKALWRAPDGPNGPAQEEGWPRYGTPGGAVAGAGEGSEQVDADVEMEIRG